MARRVWRKIERPSIFTWDEPGTEWFGRILAMEMSKKFKDRPLIVGVTEDGVGCKVACPSMLEDLLKTVPREVLIRIVYVSNEDVGKKEDMKVFEVYVADDE